MAFDTFPCNPYPISKGMLEKGNNDELNTRVTALEGEVSDLNDTKANQITIAPFFSAEASYEVGDLVYYNGLSYRCTNDHEGEWDADDFAATTVSGELATLKSGLTSVTSKVPIRGAFTVACSVGQNIFNRNTMTLVEGTIPTHSFAYCLFGICNHGSSLDSPNTVESDGADSIIINAKSAQNIRIGWLDMTNIPFQTT